MNVHGIIRIHPEMVIRHMSVLIVERRISDG